MRIFIDHPGRIDAAQLHSELVAAGIAMQPVGTGIPIFMRDGSRFSIHVPDGTNEQLVRQVVAAHTPGPEATAAQIKREQARKLLASDDSPESVRLRAVIRVLYGSLVETRTWCNQMRQQLQAAGMPTPPRLQNRTWGEAMLAVLDQIDAKIPDEEANEMEVPK